MKTLVIPLTAATLREILDLFLQSTSSSLPRSALDWLKHRLICWWCRFSGSSREIRFENTVSSTNPELQCLAIIVIYGHFISTF